MKSNVSTPVMVGIVVVVLAIVAFVGWKMFAPPAAPVNEKGIPLVPAEARAGSQQMSDIFKNSQNRPSLTPPTSNELPPARPPFHGTGPR